MEGIVLSIVGLVAVIIFFAISTARNRSRANDSHAAAVQKLIDEQNARAAKTDDPDDPAPGAP